MRNKFFRQALSAEFELQIHSIAEAGEPLTADTLETMYGTLNKKYYSAGAVVDELITIEWARIPHFYYNFYVYQYATGISAASSLVQQILYEGRPAIKRYLNFLSSGSSDYSIELLKKAGVDITTSLPVYQALQVFKSHLSQTEVLHDERRQL
jgi:oligoendopeptidase F